MSDDKEPKKTTSAESLQTQKSNSSVHPGASSPTGGDGADIAQCKARYRFDLFVCNCFNIAFILRRVPRALIAY